MQVLGAGAIPVQEAIEYVCGLPNLESILFGASSKQNIENTTSTIRHFDKERKLAEMEECNDWSESTLNASGITIR